MLFLVLPVAGWAQGTTNPTFHAQSTLVLVPALVLDENGKVVFGLTAGDFLIKDNGKEQTVHLDEASDSKPVSLVVAVQTSRRSAEALGSSCGQPASDDPFAPRLAPCASALRGVGLMLEPFLLASGSEMAIVTFDSRVKLRQSFTSDTHTLAQQLSALPEGDSDNAILDALRYSLELLRHRPAEHRKVLVLISELRDHGSTTISFEEVARRITAMNAEFYAVAFSGDTAGGIADVLRDMSAPIFGGLQNIPAEPSTPGSGPPSRGVGNLGLMPLIHAVADRMKTNIPEAVAGLTGGEYIVFSNAHSFDVALGSLGNHAQNRYQLSFQAVNPAPGPHKLEVLLSQRIGARVVARTSYWPNPEIAPSARQHGDPAARR